MTGGKHLDGFVRLIEDLLVESGTPRPSVFWKTRVEVPGFFRATKKWDILVVSDEKLIATIEFKAIVGSFGNNLNNRTEEALGNALDLLTAYREGAFNHSLRPWLGFLLVMLDNEESVTPVGVKEPHFPVLPEFKGKSYQQRGAILLQKLIRERLYDAACFITSKESSGRRRGDYAEPSEELSFRNFSESLLARALAHRSVR